ncbi:ABC transporter ATP-binding protein [Paenibacillus sp. GbtcB18]|uniref:ABC transporter ATP-binding protein n=1 Tax=Paenibacillus sp. GbtcB18 TaxID=2824763 RepID=UPI001C3076C7|nr:ABC transporter ATP-binding protein [Paenibacillus sp. GbtcB18]
MSIIEVEHVTKVYDKGNVRAVNDVTFDVNEGEVFGLLGPNGAGKSTTFKMLTTLIRPTDGVIRMFGESIAMQPREIRSRIGYVSQQGGLDESLTAYENLRWVGKLYHISSSGMERAISDALETVDLLAVKDRLLYTYSGGMKRRLFIASALLHRPKILFLDEPTVGLDLEHRQQLWEALKVLHDRGTTVFITTHYLEEADKLCDRIMIMDSGHSVCIGEPQVLKDQVGGDQIFLSFSSSITTVDESLLQRQIQEALPLMSLQQISVGQNGEELRLWVDYAHKHISQLIDWFASRNLHVTSVRISQPTLDDVMIQYTKRSLADDKNAAVLV